MTWSRVKSTGFGKLRFRLSIDGIGTEPVTDIAMVQTVTSDNGRVRQIGLKREGLVDEWEAVLERGTVKAQGMTVQIADPKGSWRQSFARIPDNETWLNQDLTVTATEMSVKATAGWSYGDILYLGTETILIGPVGGEPPPITTTSFPVLTRGIWNSVAQYHYTGDGDKITYAEVTSHPRTLESRLARLFVYGDGDDPQGDGTQVWLGCVATEPKRVSPVMWELTLDPITRMLEQPIGADLGDEMHPRGVYRPWSYKFILLRGVNQYSPRRPDLSAGFKAYECEVAAGFYNPGDFIPALTAELVSVASTVTGWTSPVIGAAATAEGGYDIIWKSDGKWVDIHKVDEDLLDGWYLESHFVRVMPPTGTGDLDPTDSQSSTVNYAAIPGGWDRRGGAVGDKLAGCRTEPRGYWGFRADDASATPPNRIYLDGRVSPDHTEQDIAIVTWPDTGATLEHEILDSDAADNWIELGGSWDDTGRGEHYYTSELLPTIRMARRTSSGHLGNFVSDLATNAPRYMNKGAYPAVTEEVVDTAEWVSAVGSVALHRYQNDREFTTTKPTRLDQYLAEELKVVQMMMVPDSSGKIVPRAILVRTSRDPDLIAITDSTIDLKAGWPQWEVNQLGTLHTIDLSPNFDVGKGRHEEPSLVMVDQRARSKNPLGQTLKIKPYSRMRGVAASRTTDVVPISEFLDMFRDTLGLLGGAYAIINICCTMKNAESPTIGDGVSLTCRHLPNWIDGSEGVTDLTCLVIGRRREWDQGRVWLKLISVASPYVGYTPTLGVKSIASGSDGTIGPFVYNVHLGDPIELGGADSWEEGGGAITDYFATGMRVQIRRWNHATANIEEGTVGTVTSSTIQVTWDSAFTHGSEEHTIAFTPFTDTAMTAAQYEYGSWAGDAFTISEGADTKPARKYA